MSIEGSALANIPRSSMYSSVDAYVIRRIEELEAELGKKKEAAKKAEGKPPSIPLLQGLVVLTGLSPLVGMLMMMGYAHLWNMTVEVIKTMH